MTVMEKDVMLQIVLYASAGFNPHWTSPYEMVKVSFSVNPLQTSCISVSFDRTQIDNNLWKGAVGVDDALCASILLRKLLCCFQHILPVFILTTARDSTICSSDAHGGVLRTRSDIVRLHLDQGTKDRGRRRECFPFHPEHDDAGRGTLDMGTWPKESRRYWGQMAQQSKASLFYTVIPKTPSPGFDALMNVCRSK
nr:hypothetical protein CFP56_37221 [Quercus suber]